MNKARVLKGILNERKYIDEVYINVFNLLHTKNGLDYTDNNNGIFFNVVIPDNEEIISEVLSYLENIQFSHQSHIENLNNIENTIDNFKTMFIENETPVKEQVITKKKPRPRVKSIKNPFKQEYKGVYKRLNDIMKKRGHREKEFAEYDDVQDENEEDGDDTAPEEIQVDSELIEEECDDIIPTSLDRDLEIELFGDISGDED